MKKLLLILLILQAFAVSVVAQDAAKAKYRKVYAWDVTLSMRGGVKYTAPDGTVKTTPDIWQRTKDMLIKDIEMIADPNVEILILAFQHDIIKELRGNSTDKAALVREIRSFNIPKMWVGNAESGHAVSDNTGTTTMTRLHLPLQNCLDNHIKGDVTNILTFMTDGVSDFEDDAEKFRNYVREELCGKVEEKDVYMFYIMLTPQSRENEELMDSIESKRVRPVPEPMEIKSVFLTPPDMVTFHTHKNHKGFSVEFDRSSLARLKPGYKVHIKSSDNPYLNIDSTRTYEINPDTFSITIDLNADPDVLREIRNSSGIGEFTLSFEPDKSMKDSIEHSLVFIDDKPTVVEVVAKQENTVTINWEIE